MRLQKALLTKWRSWQNSPWVWKIFKLDEKSGLLESGDYDENGEYDENSESSQQWQKIAEGLAKSFIRLQEALLAKKEKLTEWRIWQKCWIWPKFTMGLTNIQVGCQKWPLGKWRLWWNGEQGEIDEFGDNSPKMQWVDERGPFICDKSGKQFAIGFVNFSN